MNSLTGESGVNDRALSIPAGYYNIDQMVDLFNAILPFFENDGFFDTPLCYGLGEDLATAVLFDMPAADLKQPQMRFAFNQYPELLQQVYDGAVPNPFQYTSYDLIFGYESYGLLARLGMILPFTKDQLDRPDITYSIPVSVSASSYDPVSNKTTVEYTVSSSIIANYTFNMVATKSLYIELAYPASQFRSPFNKLDTSPMIARVPVEAAYGWMFDFWPQNLVFSQHKNLTLSQIVIRIYDDFGERVNFQGSDWAMDLNVKFAESETDASPSLLTSDGYQHPVQAGYNNSSKRDVFGTTVPGPKRSKTLFDLA